jgi:DnaK suppressor protein
MDTRHFQTLLRNKERDLLKEMAGLTDASARPEQPDVEDFSDRATDESNTDTSIGQGAVLTSTLADVRAALKRIDDGTYGKCDAGGHQIDAARLEAIPWTRTCIEHGKRRPADQGSISL